MTEKTTNKEQEKTTSYPYKKLSIQVGLNGLSFCIIDTIAHKVVKSDSVVFKMESTPYLLLKELRSLFDKHGMGDKTFEAISVVHKNNLFCLVPRALFQEDELPNYLKFNSKLLAGDEVVFDEIPNYDINSVYVPFTNINNYLLELFGPFSFCHHSTNIIRLLLNQAQHQKATCYAHVSERTFELIVLEQKRLLLYNQFTYKTKEDFLYYLLFTYEQLGLDPETTTLKMFGAIEEGDALFNCCYDYIKTVSVFVPQDGEHLGENEDGDAIDFTLLA